MISLTTHPSSAAELRAAASYLLALAAAAVCGESAAPILETNPAPTRAEIGLDSPDVGTDYSEGMAKAAAAAAEAVRKSNEQQAQAASVAQAAAVFGAVGLGIVPPAVLAPAASVPSVPVVPPPPVTPSAPSASVPSVALPPAVVAALPVGDGLTLNQYDAARAGIELDATGLPWDGRIHSGGGKDGKPKNQDGTWRQRRGLNDAAFKARVEAELRAAMAAPSATPFVAPAVPAVPPSASSATPPAPVGTAATASPSSVPAVPVPPAPASAANPTPADTAPARPPEITLAASQVGIATLVSGSSASALPANLPELMQQVTPLIASGRMNMQAVNDACASAGVASLAVLGARPDLVPTVWAQLQVRLAA